MPHEGIGVSQVLQVTAWAAIAQKANDRLQAAASMQPDPAHEMAQNQVPKLFPTKRQEAAPKPPLFGGEPRSKNNS